MFSNEYLNNKASEIGTNINQCLAQIYALGEVRAEERFRYQRLWQKANELTYRLIRFQNIY